jgi:hypothetical protein
MIKALSKLEIMDNLIKDTDPTAVNILNPIKEVARIDTLTIPIQHYPIRSSHYNKNEKDIKDMQIKKEMKLSLFRHGDQCREKKILSHTRKKSHFHILETINFKTKIYKN